MKLHHRNGTAEYSNRRMLQALKLYDGRSQKEVAEIMGVRGDTVRRYIYDLEGIVGGGLLESERIYRLTDRGRQVLAANEEVTP